MNTTKEEYYTVYRHITPDGMIYIGTTNNIKKRCYPSLYRCEPFKSYIQHFGWENLAHEILEEFTNKEDALIYEDALIKYYQDKHISLNKNRSGYGKLQKIEKTAKKLKKEAETNEKKTKRAKNNYIKHKTYFNNYNSNFRQTTEGKIYNRVASYNHYRTKRNKKNEIFETPSEARQKYIDFGYIPSYIKNDDLY